MINPNKKYSFYVSFFYKTEKKKDVKVYVWERILNEVDKLKTCKNDLSLIINEKIRLKKIRIYRTKKEKQFTQLLKDIKIVFDNYLFKKGNLGWSVFTKHDLVLKSKEIINNLSFYLIKNERNLFIHNSFIYNTNKSNCIIVKPLLFINHHCKSSLSFKEDGAGNLIGFYNTFLNTVKFKVNSKLFIQYTEQDFLGFVCKCCNDGIEPTWIEIDDNVNVNDSDFSNFNEYLLLDDDIILEEE